MIVTEGSTDVTVPFYFVDDVGGTNPGEPTTGLLFSDIETGGSASYQRQGAARVDFSLVTLASASAAHTDGGFILVDDTEMPGVYRCDIPDAAIASGVDFVIIYLRAASANNTITRPLKIDLTTVDLREANGRVDVGEWLGTAVPAPTVAGTPRVEVVSALAAFFQDCFTVNSGEVSGAEVSGSLILEIAKVVWDRILSGATHNIATSAGRRLRGIQTFQGYEDGAIWIDTVNGSAGTVDFENGTVENPVDTIADANTLAASLGISRFHIAPASSITFAATQANQVFIGDRWTVALGGQSVSGSYFRGADVSGIGTGAAEIRFDHCHLGAVTLPPSDLEGCVLEGTFTIGTAGNFFLENCSSGVAGTSTPILDFGSALNSSNVNFRAWSGGIEIQNMGAGTGSYDMSLEGWGQLVINANCSATSAVAIRGCFTVTDNAGGAVTLSDEARYEVQVITGGAYALNTTASGNIGIDWANVENPTTALDLSATDTQLCDTVTTLTQTKTGYDGGAVWVDTNASNTNTVSYVDGTADNPVSTIAAATTIASNLGIKKFHLVSGSSITLTQAYNFYTFDGYGATIALGGQSVNGAVFIGGKINGNDDGSNANRVRYFDCDINGSTLGQFIMCRTRLTAGTLTLAEAGSYFMDSCYSGVAGTGTPAIDFGAGLNASNLNMRHYSGGIEIENMGAGTGSYNMSLEGFGQLVINANCSATSTVAIRGNFTVTDNAGGAVTLSDDARIDVAQINAEMDTALNTAIPGSPAANSINERIVALDDGTAPPIGISGNVDDAAPAVGDFDGDAALSATNDFYNGAFLVFTSGTLKGIGRQISDYDGTSKNLVFSGAVGEADEPFPVAPGNSDTFLILGRFGT